MQKTEEATPLMRQYWDLKSQAPDALLLFRMGDFYELFGEDAVSASRILEITLTSRDKNKENPLPMAGVPWHSAQSYIQRLLKAGQKVAIAEQMEDPELVKGKTIVRREIVRIFTPGIQFEAEGSDLTYLATALEDEKGTWTLALLDAATGESRVSHPLTPEQLLEESFRPQIKHWIRIGDRLPEAVADALRKRSDLFFEELASNSLLLSQAQDLLRKLFSCTDLSSLLPHRCNPNLGVHTLGFLFQTVLKSQRLETLTHARIPRPLRVEDALGLGPKTAQHLNLLPRDDGQPDLFRLINKTRSALGARLLRKRLEAPFRSPREILSHQQAIQELAATSLRLDTFSKLFSQVYDLERISARLTTGLANPRDTVSLAQSLSILPALEAALAPLEAPLLRARLAELQSLKTALIPLGEHLLRVQKPDAPFSAKEGQIFNKGWNPELDHLIDLTERGEQRLIELEARERSATGISNLKVKFNRVFGYSIEVTQSQIKLVPPHYVRKQTLAGAERYITEELKQFEDEILNAASRRKSLEHSLFETLLEHLKNQIPWLMKLSELIAELDVMQSLAHLTQNRGYTFPVVDESFDLEVNDARHPLVELSLQGGFVPNSVHLAGQGANALLITGPNMGGKSTVMRQIALIVILGQLGAPVPAREARWGYFSSIHTRIGADDAIAFGQSTFMVEMTELASIVHHADARSLLILDEIGRGTSTYDGMSVAWSALEWICTQIQARTLFATHYHELTGLSRSLPRLANAHLAVEVAGTSRENSKLRFLYELKSGPASDSFGIHVAQMAGLPAPLIERAWQILDHLEAANPGLKRAQRSGAVKESADPLKGPVSPQLHLF